MALAEGCRVSGEAPAGRSPRQGAGNGDEVPITYGVIEWGA